MAKVTVSDEGLFGDIVSQINGNFDEIYGRTGWASHADTQYTQGSPFSVLANTDTNLPNNSGTVINSQKPTDITAFYSGGKIIGRNGDALAMQIFFYAVPTIVDQHIDIWIDIGAPIGVLYPQTFSFPKGTGQPRGIMYALPAAYTLSTWQTNGGTVRVRSNGAMNVYGMTYNFVRTHKAR